MKILVLSDLHVEFKPFVPDPAAVEAADVVVLAGDIHVRGQGIPWARNTFVGKPIVYVAGNHEFYGRHWRKHLDELREQAAAYGVHFLENDSVTIDGIGFLGATLWTDFLLFGEDKKSMAIRDAMTFMSDFGAIKADPLPQVVVSNSRRNKLSPWHTLQRHKESLAWLKAELATGDHEKTVVVTHHYPNQRSTAPKFSNDLVSAIFGSNLPNEVLLGAKFWVHGHTHDSCNYRIGDSKRAVRVVCNPRGYPLGWLENDFENKAFDPKLTLEV